MERNKGNADHNGLFASHPDTQARVASIGNQIKTEKLAATALATARYSSTITFDVKPLAEIAAVAAGPKGVAGGGTKTEEKKTEEKKEEPKKKGFGLGLGGIC